MEGNDTKLLSVSDVSREYNLSKYTIYGLIKADPTFPAINVGPKKNYRIQLDQFRVWLERRMKERQYFDFKVPSADQLFRLGRN